VKRLFWCWLVVTACRAPAIPEANRFPAGTGFTARRLTVDGTTLRYIDAGHGPPVVFRTGSAPRCTRGAKISRLSPRLATA
jgi:hypothetical protein